MENSMRNKDKKDKGMLMESISGQGFSAKRKRSEIVRKNETSNQRYWARFISFPALEIQFTD
ncbi:hypothetical protein FRX31_012189 [Thalictrum thalictroides]|uniref:Uncharacterized protein n=1 Tax=Thalictrum thalictroides TaxID=46969 RepID=A0A7J6WP45_THATH|nr:hypothetical protein FRX31_012189 [Thalictrum thalictroides]